MNKKLTNVEEDLLDAIKYYINEYKIPPTIKELANMLGFKSINSIQRRLICLEDKGYIKTTINKARSIVLL